jgi:hypothetical protein
MNGTRPAPRMCQDLMQDLMAAKSQNAILVTPLPSRCHIFAINSSARDPAFFDTRYYRD